MGPAPAEQHMQLRTCTGNICCHSFHPMGYSFHSQTCCPVLQCPGLRAHREVQGGNWHLFSSQTLCKTGMKAIARKHKTKQALRHTSRCSPCSLAGRSAAIRLMQLQSSLLTTTTVAKRRRSLDTMPGPDAQSLIPEKPFGFQLATTTI